MPAYTRGPALLAQHVASLCDAAPGRFAFGIGTSSNVIVEQWNGIPFDEPYKRVRDTVRFLRAALSGEKVTEDYETFSVKGFRLGVKVAHQPPILIAALRPGMLRLAGREGDGAIVNWLSAEDVKTVVPHVGAGKEIVARIFVLPVDDRDLAYGIGKRAIASYLTVPVYAAFHDWLGRGRAAGRPVAAVEGRRPEGRRSVDPRRGRRRPAGVGRAREDPRAPRALRRQRRHHSRAGDLRVRGRPGRSDAASAGPTLDVARRDTRAGPERRPSRPWELSDLA
ncbi:MAG: LLM class flavin-dependent oxidoreductase [Acidimicrobiia bacterium]|nr:LLM class flavin-dependent oxidoreductase [Acidimicrobiia bacterium]